VTRYVVLLREAAPLRGCCPACDSVMDASGCRIGDDVRTHDPDQTRGITRVVEVFCKGHPTAPIVECPACP
jgi:hypothetical protein